MSEENTFRKLKQTPYNEVKRLFVENKISEWSKITTVKGRNNFHDKFLAEHGWSWKEWQNETNKGVYKYYGPKIFKI